MPFVQGGFMNLPLSIAECQIVLIPPGVVD